MSSKIENVKKELLSDNWYVLHKYTFDLKRKNGGSVQQVREVYDRGLQYLATSQSEDGDWKGGQNGPGVTGMGLMVFLASGEDPNFGIYSNHIRKALRSIISQQTAATGIMGNSMYHHGFATLGLAGMVVARAGLELEPGSLLCQLAAGCWIAGGLGYTALGLSCLVSAGRRKTRRAVYEGDLSVLVRRR